MTDESALIGIDWGNSRLRAFRISGNGQLLERRANDCGVTAIRDGNFAQVLAALVAGWPSDLPIVMCGMVGSRHGWQEIDYQPCPAGAQDLARALCPIKAGQDAVWIVGGLRSLEPGSAGSRDAIRVPNVMRGEETQMVGIACGGGQTLMVAPGTHSKWAVMREGRIEGFRTYMTGELYALLTTHSTLGRLMDPATNGEIDAASFLRGVHLGLEEPALSRSLFSVRTHALFGQRPAAGLSSFLSGILIGSEVGAEQRRNDLTAAAVTVIAGSQLADLYATALAAVGCRTVQRIDSDVAVVRGLWRIWELRRSAA